MPKFRTTLLIVLALSGFALLGSVLGCGDKSSSGPTNPPPPAPPSLSAPSNLTYAQPTLLATVGTAIAPDSPTVTGTVTRYSVTPATPNRLVAGPVCRHDLRYTECRRSSGELYRCGLECHRKGNCDAANFGSSDTGAIESCLSADDYQRKGRNRDCARYTYCYRHGCTILNLTCIGRRIAARHASVGTISGTPTAPAAQANYTITAGNSTGNATAQLTITVNSAGTVLLEQGHGTSILAIRMAGDRVLSEDLIGHWVLWVYSTGDLLAQGDGAGTADKNQIDLAGPLAAISTSQGVQVYSTQDGHLIFTIPPPSWWRLAQDGSYVCAGTTSALTVWSTTGQTEFALNGNYSAAVAFAAPGQVQVAAGPAGSSVIETDTVPAGTSMLSPKFSGNFYAWFLDGNRFLTNLGTAVWVYSNSGDAAGSCDVAVDHPPHRSGRLALVAP